MRKVFDSNVLQSERLREYLSKSTQNYVVLTDFAAMEAYKGNTLTSIYRSMKILARYPKQVIVLKGTQAVCGLRGRAAGLQRRLIDERQTQDFGEYCQHLHAAKRGDLFLQNQLLHHGHEATAHMDRMLADAADIPSTFDEVAKTYTATELQVLRKGSQLTEEMIDKLIQNILLLAAQMFKDHPRATKWPDVVELPNTFIFRSTLCGYLLFLRWISVGGARKIRPERMRNDIVDVNFAAYATYFDGLLTEDKKLNGIYREAEFLLAAIFTAKTK